MSESRNEILFNEAALNALKRHQLQSLTRRYGLKSNGKNSDMVQRLQDFAVTMSPDQIMFSPPPATTPGPNEMFSEDNMEEASPTPVMPTAMIEGQSRRVRTDTGNGSGSWEMLSDSGASLISPAKPRGMGERSDSQRSWKSARNGQKLDEFGGSTTDLPSSGSMNSIKSLASSIKRSASQHLLSRSRRNSINMLSPPAPVEPETVEAEEEEVEMIESLPPSPASTVGVPRRYSGLSLLERPSTIRLVASPPPPEPDSEDEADDLPFVGTAMKLKLLKERRSMAPLRSLDGSAAGISLTRKSMPAISASSSNSASVPNIYPPLPPIPAQFQRAIPAPEPSMPGALSLSPVRQHRSEPFVFGTPNAVTNREFSDAGKAILAQMNAKMPEGFAFNEEHLKGRQAGVSKLVKSTSTLGEGGWGLSGLGQTKPDRYAEAHQREFSRMRSISKQNLASSTSRLNLAASTSASTTARAKTKASTVTLATNAGATPSKRKRSSVHLPSAPNGAPLPIATTEKLSDEDKMPEAKKTRRMSYLGSLADAGRSLLSLGEGEKGSVERSVKKVKPKRRSSLLPGGFKSKFGWLSRKKKIVPAATQTKAASYPAPIMPRKTSVYAPRNPPVPRPVFDLNASLSKSTTSTRAPTSYTSPTIAQKQRQASSSAQTMLSVSTARSTSRSRIPDFGPGTATSASAISSVSTLGLSKPSASSSAASSMRKQSQADILKKVRPAPAPPAEVIPPVPTRPKATSTITSSRLYAPTASSLARMQATVKPYGSRPMPSVPGGRAASSSTSTTSSAAASTSAAAAVAMPASQPFGSAASRDNIVFGTNFNVPQPPASTSSNQGQGGGLRKGKSQSLAQLKSPLKSAASSRIRGQASGISAVKSRPDLRKEREVQAKRAEIKAKQDRLGEERELRRMLGDEQ